MASEVVQETFDGDTLAVGSEKLQHRPNTIVACPQCGAVMLRRQRHDHPHDVLAEPDDEGDGDEESLDEKDVGDEPEIEAHWYDITLEYNVTYRLRVPAFSEHRAEEIAKDWHWDEPAADAYHVHTDRRQVSEVTAEDVPDDYDPYGSEPLHEAIERAEDGDDDGE